MSEFDFVSLSLKDRPQLFAQIAEYGQSMRHPLAHGTFGGRFGWLVADGDIAAAFLTSTAGVKSRPIAGQKYLGGVGALQGNSVASVKKQLVAALATAARSQTLVHLHLTAALGHPSSVIDSGRLTEAFSSSMLTQLTGREPGSIAGPVLRDLVMHTWEHLERAQEHSRIFSDVAPDDLEALIERLVVGSDSGFLSSLRRAAWTDYDIARELRAMVLAGWGSTTAATLSALVLRRESPVQSQFFLNEVMRLYPPGFMLGRTIVECNEKFPFEVGDIVVVSPWLVHRNGTRWARPEVFDVTRWGKDTARGWFMPFGIGPRRCPASSLAKAQIAAALGVFSPPTHSWRSSAALSMVEQRSPALVPEAVTGGCPVHWAG